MTTPPVGTLRTVDLRKSYGELEVLHGINLEIPAGTTTCIIGPSGSGKSTLIRLMNNLEEPDGGYVEMDEEIIGYERNPRGRLVESAERRIQRQRQQIGMVFQRFNLFPHMSALDNVMLGPRLLRGMSKQAARDEALFQLERVGMLQRRDAYARQLSGGQQQRVAIARALAMRPRAMLFDEPTSALDPELVGEVLNVMQQIAAEGMTMVVVTHELTFARDVAERVVFMADGNVVEEGRPAGLFDRPREERTRLFVSRVFGGAGVP